MQFDKMWQIDLLVKCITQRIYGHLVTNEVATRNSTRHQPSRHQEVESPPAKL